ncbi:prophage Lp1 protein 31 [Lactiplantibacillus plantarum]|nr:prophage Lp1 protein 31 [Lactiplantibacillus plantarum]KZU85748.1 prophage Lp1 protein 31 [Lactiplantibacillus plantarum]
MEILDGWENINVGDWIATGVNGEHWPIADDVFKKTYAELPVIPKNVAKHIVTEHGLSDLIPIWGGIYRAMIQTVVYGYQKGDIGDWIINHSDMFARAWLDGYVVEGKHD